jgi:hypothetical protein
MGDLHVVVVNNVGEVVGRETIPLHDDKVILGVLLAEAVVDHVSDHEGPLSALEAYCEPFPLVGAFIRLLGGDVETCTRIEGWLSGNVGVSLVFLQGLGGAKAPVCLTLPDELVGVFLVEGQSFGLGQSVLGGYRWPWWRDLTCLYGPYGPFWSGPGEIVSAHIVSHDRLILTFIPF